MDTVKPLTSIWFVAAWFSAATTALIFAITFSFFISHTRLIKPVAQNLPVYAALPESTNYISDEIQHADGRAKIIEDFFKGYKAPLSGQGEAFIKIADKYQLDYRLLPAIAMQESNGGKRVIKDSFNPFGYGIYGNLVIRFNSWEEAIERVGRALREDYLNKGLKNPTQIMAKYTPPSLAKEGAWAKGVNTFMEELR
jgi:hypothetical protein